MIAALIVAAGKGVRMGGPMPKQYLDLCGRPILLHTLHAFDACPRIDRIILVIPLDQWDYCRDMLKNAPLRAGLELVAGGARRQDSVANGLAALEGEGIVLIHDGVRPLIDTRLIEACIAGAERWGACIPALEVTDTLKKASSQGIIEGTVSREALYMAQTPQAFRLSLIKAAHHTAGQCHREATDDASLVEQMGSAVHIIQGSAFNIKITTPEDLRRAEMLLGGGKRATDQR